PAARAPRMGFELPPPPAESERPSATLPTTPGGGALATSLEPGLVLTQMAEPPSSPRGIYIVAALASLLWAGALAAFVYGYETRVGAMQLTPVVLAFVALLAFAPMG